MKEAPAAARREPRPPGLKRPSGIENHLARHPDRVAVLLGASGPGWRVDRWAWFRGVVAT
jgi:hypothetical protein